MWQNFKYLDRWGGIWKDIAPLYYKEYNMNGVTKHQLPEYKELVTTFLFGEKPTDNTRISMKFNGEENHPENWNVALTIAQTDQNPITINKLNAQNLNEIIIKLSYMRDALIKPYVD